MSRKDVALIACRVLAIYFLCSALDLASYLPDQILSAFHYLGLRDRAEGAYLFRHNVSSLIFAILRVGAFAFLSWWFYRHSPELQNLLLPAEEATKAE